MIRYLLWSQQFSSSPFLFVDNFYFHCSPFQSPLHCFKLCLHCSLNFSFTLPPILYVKLLTLMYVWNFSKAAKVPQVCKLVFSGQKYHLTCSWYQVLEVLSSLLKTLNYAQDVESVVSKMYVKNSRCENYIL